MLLGVQCNVKTEPQEVDEPKEVRPDIDAFIVDVEEALYKGKEGEDWPITTLDKRPSRRFGNILSIHC